MANQDWSNLGDDIKNLVQSAVDSKDFKKLNETIGKTINSAMENVNQGLSQAGDKINEAGEKINKKGNNGSRKYDYGFQKVKAQNPWERKRTSDYQVMRAPYSPLFKSTAGITGAGLALAITGYTLATGLGIGTIVLYMIGLISGGMGGGMQIALGILVPLLIGSSWMAGKGTKLLGRARRFKTYTINFRNRNYCSIKELARSVGKKEGFVLKDIKDMIRRRMFAEGHLDKQQTCLMVSHEAYDQYQTAQLQLEERQKVEAHVITEKEVKVDKLPEEVRKVIEEGNDYIRQIRACNDAILGEEISAKISHMEVIIKKIFNRVERHPELVSDLHKFMGYYLPTTVKLLHAYEELDSQPVQGNNIISSKAEIENTLDTVNQAFENLLDSFFQDTAWDISSDISVLQTMLAQEGLTNSDFKSKAEGLED